MSDTEIEPNFVNPEKKANEIWSIEDHPGEIYTAVIARFHNVLKPKTYLEIGVAEGITLQLARCQSIAVDPQFKLNAPVLDNKNACSFYQMTSDEFFGKYSPTDIFGRQIDMAFLDGMHWFEYLLRDFINVERHCKNNSVLILHDCIPTDEFVGRRLSNDLSLRELSKNKGWWAGDVWKVVAILQKYRKDLQVIALSAPPTGLVCVTNLNQSSNLLSERYFEIVEEFRDTQLATYGSEYMRLLKLQSTNSLSAADMISAAFWI